MRISDWSSDVCSSDLEMVAPVAEQGDAIDQPPAKQFLDRIGNVRAREAEHFGDLLGMERKVGNEEQSMDLRDRAIDAPLPRADERRVGNESVIASRTRGSPCHEKKHKNMTRNNREMSEIM